MSAEAGMVEWGCDAIEVYELFRVTHDLASIDSSDCRWRILDLRGLDEGIYLRLVSCC